MFWYTVARIIREKSKEELEMYDVSLKPKWDEYSPRICNIEKERALKEGLQEGRQEGLQQGDTHDVNIDSYCLAVSDYPLL